MPNLESRCSDNIILNFRTLPCFLSSNVDFVSRDPNFNCGLTLLPSRENVLLFRELQFVCHQKYGNRFKFILTGENRQLVKLRALMFDDENETMHSAIRF